MFDPYLAGLLLGDGTLFRGKNRAYAVWIDQHLRNRRILDRAEEKLKANRLNVHRYSFLNKERVLVYSKETYLAFKNLKRKPVEYFKSLDEKAKFQFISGFLDAEGTITDRLVIYSKSRELLEAMQSFIVGLGVNCYIYKFGKVYGLQVYERKSIAFLSSRLNSVKLDLLRLVKKRS
jgi:hypothetical protein